MLSHVADSFRRSNMKGTTNDGTYSPDYSLASVDLKELQKQPGGHHPAEQEVERVSCPKVQFMRPSPAIPLCLMPHSVMLDCVSPRFPLLQNMQALRGIYNLAIHKKIDYS